MDSKKKSKIEKRAWECITEKYYSKTPENRYSILAEISDVAGVQPYTVRDWILSRYAISKSKAERILRKYHPDMFAPKKAQTRKSGEGQSWMKSLFSELDEIKAMLVTLLDDRSVGDDPTIKDTDESDGKE